MGAQHGSLTNDQCYIAGQHHMLQPDMVQNIPKQLETAMGIQHGSLINNAELYSMLKHT